MHLPFFCDAWFFWSYCSNVCTHSLSQKFSRSLSFLVPFSLSLSSRSMCYRLPFLHSIHTSSTYHWLTSTDLRIFPFPDIKSLTLIAILKSHSQTLFLSFLTILFCIINLFCWALHHFDGATHSLLSPSSIDIYLPTLKLFAWTSVYHHILASHPLFLFT